jgi:hypothetical protein
MGRSQWSAATAWQETALPVPVHAAAIIGESMDEARAKITVMDKNRRILQRHYTFIFGMKAIEFRVAGPAKIVKLFNPHPNNGRYFHLYFSATLVYSARPLPVHIHMEAASVNWLHKRKVS